MEQQVYILLFRLKTNTYQKSSSTKNKIHPSNLKAIKNLDDSYELNLNNKIHYREKFSFIFHYTKNIYK